MNDSERKAAARKWNEAHKNLRAEKVRKSLGDNPDKDIPSHGPKAKTQHKIPLSNRLLHTSTLSSDLICRMTTQSHRDNWNAKIGSQLIYSRLTPLVVVDTNVFVRAAATKPQADCRRVIDVCIAGEIVPCVTEPIVFEYLEVIGRGILEDGLRFDQESDGLLNKFLTHCLALTGEPAALPFRIPRDRSDEKFVVAKTIAEENTGRQCYIVSRDSDLLGIDNAREALIFHPTGFLELLATGLLAF
ncbi:MAG: hypothetical protein UU93_C0005G0032 [Candidatus Amesbacteria bacterium GW2011_GWA2_42_12]|uniref:PIN domain-containing protein n=1 Tax=Candidatus Amesbacteria bacterium GW2011_GWA2_42_12 TaxID=1618356 RepID=A0A0G0Y7P0_9BACT|nr:MAG: hypothetical protein UU93_C0005G0032 [Candidatus Amesbacteria bacterium GW2011_GWA2_42_12]